MANAKKREMDVRSVTGVKVSRGGRHHRWLKGMVLGRVGKMVMLEVCQTSIPSVLQGKHRQVVSMGRAVLIGLVFQEG